MNNAVMFSSKSAEWETPQDLFDKLNEEFHFSLDVCATPENTKKVSEAGCAAPSSPLLAAML